MRHPVKFKFMHNNKGFIQLLIILVLFIIILSLLGVSLGALFENKILRDNFNFVWKSSANIWNNYLAVPAKIAWRIWVKYVWEPFVGAMNKVREGENPIPKEALPQENP